MKIIGEINEKDVRYYRDQTKPQVDLTALYTRAGLAGILLPPGPNPFTAGFGPLTDRLNELSALAGLTPLPPVSIRIEYGLAGIPGGRLWAIAFQFVARQLSHHRESNYASRCRSGIGRRRRISASRWPRRGASAIRGSRWRRTIESGVRDTMENMQMAQLRLQAAQVARESAEEQYQSEQRQFQAGTSTLFLVQQRQATMIAARSQERRSEADMSEAISAYRLATGSILTERNIQLR